MAMLELPWYVPVQWPRPAGCTTVGAPDLGSRCGVAFTAVSQLSTRTALADAQLAVMRGAKSTLYQKCEHMHMHVIPGDPDQDTARLEAFAVAGLLDHES